MRNRCNNANDRTFKRYGARGIKVCERWNDFEAFLADMGNRPSPEHSIDRIDANGNYEPSNCRWATESEQQRNRRNNHHVTIDGETKLLVEWSELSGIGHTTLLARLRRGKTSREEFLAPPR